MVRREYQGQGIGKGLIRMVRDRVSIMHPFSLHVFEMKSFFSCGQAEASGEVLALSTTAAINVGYRCYETPPL